MNNVAITCGVDLVAFGDADGHWGGAAGIAFYTGTISIPGNSLINYPCDASSLVQVRPDGTFGLRDTLSSKGNPFPISSKNFEDVYMDWRGLQNRAKIGILYIDNFQTACHSDEQTTG